MAIDTFRRLHDAGQSEPVDSALLLCTDWRRRRTSAHVLAGILATGILDDEQQDQLAEELLWLEKARYVYPLSWLGSTFIEIDLPSGQGAPRQRTVHADPKTPLTAERSVWPPLRSWAAERVLAQHRATPTDVVARARELPARDGAAVVTGAVHAADELDPAQARTVVNAALRWGHKTPRKAALERLTTWGEHDRALALAADDPDAAIRAWGQNSARRPPPRAACSTDSLLYPHRSPCHR
ncbi:hypothetical protein [Amycolatopsis sp. cmx-8-4]|uniref:hypothetical protein n=1 Tax=Amycolatopsis sp. cmx-8-4 TaxID=2790947 RepID=UPI00397D76BD